MTGNAIRAEHLIVDHSLPGRSVRALALDEFSVDAGDSVAVMGPSGCGKSTLLGLLAGLALPSRGRVVVGDTTVSALSDAARTRWRRGSLGMVYQADNLLPHLTVEENVALPLCLSRKHRRGGDGSGGGDAEPDPRALLARLGLLRLVSRLPDQLSGGQRQRVAIARAVVHRPAVLLADEPTGALDGDNARRVIDLLLEVHAEIGATLVVVTHDPDVAAHAARVHLLGRASAASEVSRAG